jgi:ABC-type phosphate/phosphonate transport system ATPase subunit
VASIEFEHVTKRYQDGFEAVRNMSLEVGDGELMILVGPSGSGKSTALRMVAGLEDITGGELKIGGEVVNDRAPKDRNVAMVCDGLPMVARLGRASRVRQGDEAELWVDPEQIQLFDDSSGQNLLTGDRRATGLALPPRTRGLTQGPGSVPAPDTVASGVD